MRIPFFFTCLLLGVGMVAFGVWLSTVEYPEHLEPGCAVPLFTMIVGGIFVVRAFWGFISTKRFTRREKR